MRTLDRSERESIFGEPALIMPERSVSEREKRRARVPPGTVAAAVPAAEASAAVGREGRAAEEGEMTRGCELPMVVLAAKDNVSVLAPGGRLLSISASVADTRALRGERPMSCGRFSLRSEGFMGDFIGDRTRVSSEAVRDADDALSITRLLLSYGVTWCGVVLTLVLRLILLPPPMTLS